jgi:membrane-associated protease RseP (regulator of RpoE activity)
MIGRSQAVRTGSIDPMDSSRSSRVRCRRGLAAAFAALSLLGDGFAAASPPIEFDPRILETDFARVPATAETERLVAQLDADSYLERRAAEEALVARRVPLSEMLGVLSRPGLSAEQRQRLVGVVARQVERIPRGALGIRMDTGRDIGRGVVVSGFVEGMPASAVLELGDRIVEIEGAPTPTANELIGAVQRRLPGEVIRLRVIRATDGIEEEKAIDLVLGSVEQLQQDDTDPFARQNPVIAERTRFIAELQLRHGASAVAVPARAIDEADDRHAELRRVDRFAALLATNAIVDRAAMKAILEKRLGRLRQESSDPRRDPRERASLREAATRYEALLREFE